MKRVLSNLCVGVGIVIIGVAAPISTLAKDYSATFSWNSQPMRIEVGNQFARIIDSWGKSQAICEILAKDDGSEWTPSSLRLSCAGPGFDALSAPATLQWAHGKKPPVIRFGTWLNGYQEAILKPRS